MPQRANRKVKLRCLCRILWERTDEDHPLTVPELIQALEAWDIKAERKSIYDDMEALRTLGMDVQSRKGKSPGWFLGERTFQLAELKLLVDAVQSSKFITQRKSSELIRKLESQASVHQARQLQLTDSFPDRQLQRQVYVDRRVKSMNESVYYTIDKLHTAIANRKAVTFKYFEYNVKKEKVFRREGKRYTVSPLGLIWDNENYYLAGYDHRSCEMRHYRVDKMAELAVTCLPLEGGFDIASYAQKHFGMFAGREGQVPLRCRNSLVGVVLDRFGRDAILVPDGEEHFTVTVPAVVSPQFLGWVFGLGDGVQILRPDWAAEELKRQLAAACLAETGWPREGGDVIALTLDGIGMGENGALWGGECLRVSYLEYAHLGGLPAVADNGGFQQPGVVQQLFHLVGVVGQIGQQGGVGVLGVDEGLQPHGVQHAFQLPWADAVLPQVDGLEPDTPFLEPALRLFGVKTLAFSKNLNVHGRSPLLSGHNIVSYGGGSGNNTGNCV